MASERQMAANRRNAQRSTGPKTIEGKQVVAGNALKHGLLAHRVLLPGEDGGALVALREGMLADLQPVGDLEHVLVEQMVQGWWRLRRLGLVEDGLFLSANYDFDMITAKAEAHRSTQTSVDELFSPGRRDAGATDEQAHAAALARVQDAEARKEEAVPRLGRAFLENERAFSALSRYEAAIERGVLRALHELQRLQAARAGQVVPAPMVADVDIVLPVDAGTADDSAKQTQFGRSNSTLE